jgi:aspartate/methionine/tyrosine aminotransferase
MKTPPFPSKRSRIDPFIVMDVMRAARERQEKGENILHLEVGQPGTSAPKAVLAAAARALETDKLGYTDAMGLPALRARIAAHYREKYALDIPSERIAITTGSSAGFVLAFLSAFDEGAAVALTNPGYPCYRQVMKTLGMTPRAIQTRAAQNWMPTRDDLLAAGAAGAGGLDGVILASPANPTGAMLTPHELQMLIETTQDMGGVYISDEIYHGLTYDGEDHSALEFSDDVIVINSFSKYYCMTGWRIGWMVLPEALIRPVERLIQNLYISTPSLSQHAAIAAFEATDDLEAVKAVYRKNRDLLLAGLPRAGLTKIVPAGGAFYLYADIRDFSDNSYDFAKKMLAETGIAATPGLDFDPQNGKAYLRFSFAGKTDEMAEAAKRLENWLG